MRVLVTGATGFVGRPLIAYLAAQNHEVIAVVRKESDVPKGSSRHIIVPKIESADWAGTLNGIDAIVHLAARVHQMNDSSNDPLAEFRAINRDATIRLAQAAAVNGVRRFVFISSVKAAVDETGLEAVDESCPAVPKSPYGISKREAETVLLAMQGLEAVVLRPPLIYGPGVKANFRLLVKLARLPLPLPFGAIRNRRSMLSVTNLTRAIELALTAPNLAGRVFYLSDGDDLSTPELLLRLALTMRRRSFLPAVPVKYLMALAAMLGQGDKMDRLTESLAVSNAAFRSATGWQPEPMQAELEKLVGSLYP